MIYSISEKVTNAQAGNAVLLNSITGAGLGFLGSHLVVGMSAAAGAIFGGIFYASIIPFNMLISNIMERAFKNSNLNAPPIRTVLSSICALSLAMGVMQLWNLPMLFPSALTLLALTFATSVVFHAIENPKSISISTHVVPE